MLQNDEIDLRDLYLIIWAKRYFIVIFTIIVILIGVIYSFVMTPVFEAKAIVKIGEYKVKVDNSNNINSNVPTKELLDVAEALVTELKVLFIDIEREDNFITDISAVEKQENFISIVSNAPSNSEAIRNIEQVVSYIQKKHNVILQEVKNSREIDISRLEKKLKFIQTREIPKINEKINTYTKDMEHYTLNLNKLIISIAKIENKTPALVLLEINEQRHLNEIIFKIQNKLKELEEQKFKLQNLELGKLEEEIHTIKSLMLPHNYQNSNVIGKIVTKDHPIKPHKTLIVTIAFVTGLILSLLIVFFMHFLNSFKEE